MDQYIAAFASQINGVTANTRRTYWNDLKHFSRWYAEREGQPPTLEAITPMVVVLYKAALVDKLEFKPATVRRRLATLHRFSQWAVEKGLMTELPTRKVKIPSVPQPEPNPLPPADVERLLQAAREDRHKLAGRNHAILRLIADAGLRVGALVALRGSDVEQAADGQTLALRVQIAGGNTRRIALPPATAAVLQDYLASHPTSPADPLFVSTRGTVLNTETVRHIVNKYAAQIGLNPREVSPRRLRRESA